MPPRLKRVYRLLLFDRSLEIFYESLDDLMFDIRYQVERGEMPPCAIREQRMTAAEYRAQPEANWP